MDTFERLPRAASAALPALADFLQPFYLQFGRQESQAALERYLTGLLTDHPRKNCDTLAAILPDTSEQQLQGLLTTMQWDADALNCQRVERMLSLPSAGDAVLIFDDTGFLKQGRASVGVARQYTGTIGKVTSCQVAVTCVYAERTLAWPVAARLYLPESWCADAARRTKAHIPDIVQFQTKPELALALLDQATAWGIPHACITADADYGDNPNFRWCPSITVMEYINFLQHYNAAKPFVSSKRELYVIALFWLWFGYPLRFSAVISRQRA